MKEHVVEIGRDDQGEPADFLVAPSMKGLETIDLYKTPGVAYEPDYDKPYLTLDRKEMRMIFGSLLSLSPGQKRRYRVRREGHKRIVFEEVE